MFAITFHDSPASSHLQQDKSGPMQNRLAVPLAPAVIHLEAPHCLRLARTAGVQVNNFFCRQLLEYLNWSLLQRRVVVLLHVLVSWSTRCGCFSGVAVQNRRSGTKPTWRKSRLWSNDGFVPGRPLLNYSERSPMRNCHIAVDVRHCLTSGPVSCLASASRMKVDTPSGSDQDTSLASSTVHVEKNDIFFVCHEILSESSMDV